MEMDVRYYVIDTADNMIMFTYDRWLPADAKARELTLAYGHLFKVEEEEDCNS